MRTCSLHSGSQANFAVYTSVLQPGDKILAMNLSHGGHLTHGNPANFSGKLYQVIAYGVRSDNHLIDYDQLAEVALREKPKMITVGASAYSRIIDFARMGEIAKAAGSLLFADIAHIAGLVASGHHPSPVPHADFVTTTTHKTPARPPRRAASSAAPPTRRPSGPRRCFRAPRGGSLMHVIAGARPSAWASAPKPGVQGVPDRSIRNSRRLARRQWPPAATRSSRAGRTTTSSSSTSARTCPISRASRPRRPSTARTSPATRTRSRLRPAPPFRRPESASALPR